MGHDFLIHDEFFSKKKNNSHEFRKVEPFRVLKSLRKTQTCFDESLPEENYFSNLEENLGTTSFVNKVEDIQDLFHFFLVIGQSF